MALLMFIAIVGTLMTMEYIEYKEEKQRLAIR